MPGKRPAITAFAGRPLLEGVSDICCGRAEMVVDDGGVVALLGASVNGEVVGVGLDELGEAGDVGDADVDLSITHALFEHE